MRRIDLRSDTVTVPTPSMRKAMADAEVGDDVYGEDPTINKLQEMAADLLGKEAGLFVPSGTMGNLAAVMVHCTRGDEVIMGNRAHTFVFEGGGVSVLGGASMYTLPNQPDGTMKLEDIKGAIRNDNPHFPRTRLVILENTHNYCGGVAVPVEYIRQVGALAHENGLGLHIDGARIFNAAVGLGIPASELVEAADSVTFCLSKGLCAPVGSVLCGSKAFIREAVRIRKQLGGGMRQAGIIAAAGVVALEEMIDRLAEDHRRAKMLSNGLSKIPGLTQYLTPPNSTNMVFISLDETVPMNGKMFAKKLAEENISVGTPGPRHFRLVTHYWITDEDIERTISVFRSLLN